MVIQFLPWVLAAAGAGASHVMTKANEEAKSDERLELVKDLIPLSAEQARSIDALKHQKVEEMRQRVALGVGPFAQLPPQASERAQAVHAALAAGLPVKDAAKLTADERREIAEAPDMAAAIRSVAARKAGAVAATTVVGG